MLLLLNKRLKNSSSPSVECTTTGLSGAYERSNHWLYGLFSNAWVYGCSVHMPRKGADVLGRIPSEEVIEFFTCLSSGMSTIRVEILLLLNKRLKNSTSPSVECTTTGLSGAYERSNH